jgi:glycosyl transferase family 25
MKSEGNRLWDGVVLINLAARPERLQRFEQLAGNVTYLDAWERLEAVDGRTVKGFGERPFFRGGPRDRARAGRGGCVLSHREALLKAKSAGWRSVLVLEDDVSFAEDFEAHVAELGEELSRVGNWGVCYLGYTQPVGPFRSVASLGGGRCLVELAGCYTTHAYVARREAYDAILRQLPDADSIWSWLLRHRAIDRWYARHLSRKFPVLAVTPGICGQYSDFSDIGQRQAGSDREAEFEVAIPSDRMMSDGAFYRLAVLWRRMKVALEGVYDAARASWKRCFGA